MDLVQAGTRMDTGCVGDHLDLTIGLKQ